MIDRWLTTPQDELIPLMKHMFDYTIHTILFAVYDFNCEDPQLVTSVHDSYNVVSSILLYPLLLQQITSELWWWSGGQNGDYQNCSVLYCVLKLCTVRSTLRWAVLTVLWIAFCSTVPVSLSTDSFVFMYVYFVFCVFFILYYCTTVEWTWWDLSLIYRTLSSFSALTLLIGSFDP